MYFTKEVLFLILCKAYFTKNVFFFNLKKWSDEICCCAFIWERKEKNIMNVIYKREKGTICYMWFIFYKFFLYLSTSNSQCYYYLLNPLPSSLSRNYFKSILWILVINVCYMYSLYQADKCFLLIKIFITLVLSVFIGYRVLIYFIKKLLRNCNKRHLYLKFLLFEVDTAL